MIKSTRRHTLNDIRRVRGELSSTNLAEVYGGKYNDFTVQMGVAPKPLDTLPTP